MKKRYNFRQLKKLGCEIVPRKYFAYPFDVARYVSDVDENGYVQNIVAKGRGIKAHHSYFVCL